jgi:AcrR family transcriptional regulator
MSVHKKAQKILDATALLFLRDGVKKVTMDEIAESAKASKVTIYKYFADKDALYLEVGRQMLTRHAAELAAIAASEGTVFQKFSAALQSISAFADGGAFSLCGELAAYNHVLDGVWAWYRNGYRASLYTLIDEGVAAGRMKPHLDRDMIFHYIDMGVAYYQQNEAYRSRMRADAGFQERFMGFFIGNICARNEAGFADA